MNKSRWSGIAEGLIEASLYLVVLLMPLLVDVNLQRVFALPKVALVRLLATVIVAAWLLRASLALRARQLPRPRTWFSHPLAWPIFAVGLTLGLSTALSILPLTSLNGGFLRIQGLWTTLSYIVLAIALGDHLRSPLQRERLIDLMLIASWPVVIYGLMQFVGLDPLSWVGYTGRVLSTLGNPVFLGAYIAFVAPLALYRCLTLLRAHRAQPSLSARVGLVWVVALLVAQGLTLFFSQSRGPFLALLIALFFLVILLSRRRVIIMALFGLALAGVLLIVAVNIPGSPLRDLRTLPVVGRLLDFGDVDYRDVIWSHVARLLASDPTRLTIGYGPEALDVALMPFYTYRLSYLGGQAQQIDRTHNLMFEALAASGLLGLAAQLALFLAVLSFGLARLGFVRTPWQRLWFIGLPLVMSGGLALGSHRMTGVWTWSGLAGGLGLALGVGLALASLASQKSVMTEDGLSNTYWLTASLLVMWLGQFIEAQFSPGTETVLLYNWLVVGFLIAMYRPDLPSSSPSVPPSTEGGAGGREEGAREDGTATPLPLIRGGIGGGGAVSTPTSLARGGSQAAPILTPHTASAGSLQDALFIGVLPLIIIIGLVDWSPPFRLNGHLAVVLGLALLTWLLSLAWLTWRPALAPRPVAPHSIVPAAYISLSLIFSGLTLYVISQFVSLVLLPVLLFYLILLAALIALGWTLTPAPPAPATRDEWVPAAVISLMALATITLLAILPHLGDRYFALGRRLVSQGQTAQGLDALTRARQIAPDQDVYFLVSSDLVGSLAAGIADPTQQAATFEQARALAQQAMRIKPGQPYHVANLAHIELRWAESTRNPQLRAAAIQRGLDNLANIGSIMTFDPAVFDDWGYLFYLRRDFPNAIQKYQAALRLERGRAQTFILLGRAHRDAGDTAAAEASYIAAVRFKIEWVDGYAELTDFYLQQDRARDALPYAQKAVELAPDNYSMHHNLALVYAKLGRNPDAVEQIRVALRYAPPSEEQKLRTLLQQLSGQ